MISSNDLWGKRSTWDLTITVKRLRLDDLAKVMNFLLQFVQQKQEELQEVAAEATETNNETF